MAGPSLTAERRGAVLRLTVDRQEVRNAYDPATLRAIAEQLRAASGRGVRLVVLTGAGTQSFSSGMDLRALKALPGAEVSAAIGEFRVAFDAPERPVVIAALNGDAVGGGLEVMLRCDLVVAAEHVSLRLPEVRHGLLPGGGATLLPARVPVAVAIELGITGEAMSAARAHQLGLINRIAPADRLHEVADQLAASVLAGAPRAVSLTRALMWTTLGDGPAAGWQATTAALGDEALRAEMAAGIAAFTERRRG